MFTESEKHILRRQCHDLLRSKEGRDLGRVFLTEISKPNGDLGAVKKEIFDLLSEIINDLYGAPKPVQSR